MNYKNIVVLTLIILSLNARSQGIIEVEKYKVYTDAIYQIQFENAVQLVENKFKTDTIEYEPIVIHKKTRYETDSIGFFLNKRLKSNQSIFDSYYLNLEKFAIIDNKNLIGLDTAFIDLYFLLDSLSRPGSSLSNNFFFNNKVILTNQLKEKKLGLFRINWDNFWERFYQKHPNSFGIFEVSDVFFSQDRDLAILYIGYQRQGLVGYGAVYMLKKEKGKWIIIKDREVWVS
jgi:hypothetical protein